MKKRIIGALVAFILLFSVSVYAEPTTTFKNLIGLQVAGQFPVTVNGVQIEEPAAVIENNGYLPIRAVGEALGVTINFDENLGILISGSVSDSVYKEQVAVLETEKLKLQEEVAVLKRQKRAEDLRVHQKEIDSEELIVKQKRLKGLEDEIKTYSEEPVIAKIQAEIDNLNKEITELNTKLGQ